MGPLVPPPEIVPCRSLPHKLIMVLMQVANCAKKLLAMREMKNKHKRQKKKRQEGQWYNKQTDTQSNSLTKQQNKTAIMLTLL